MRVRNQRIVVLALLLGYAVLANSAELTAAREIVIPAGTILRVQIENSVGSDISRIEDPVRGHLASAIVIDGHRVMPAGSAVIGSVTQAVRSGKVKGRARIGMRFHTLAPSGDSERYRIATATVTRIAPATKKKDTAEIALPAVGGSIVGALVGGKKGAAIGAAAGGGAGTAVVLSTRGKEVRLGRGAVVSVRLTAPITVRS